MDSADVSRRLVVGAGGAALSGCASAWPSIPPLPRPSTRSTTTVTDVHTHLFNAADLPAAGFIKYTVLRPWADRGAARALVDLIVQVIKPLALTVVEELHALETKTLREVDTETFARGASDRARGRRPSVARLAARAPDEGVRTQTLDQGYNDLGAILAAAYGDSALVARMTAARGRRDSPEFLEVFRRAAGAAGSSRADERAATQRAVTTLPALGPLSAAEAADPDFVGAIVRTFAWVVVMLQPRSSHLQRYVDTYSHNGLRPVRVVNLLVDMGAWLQGEEDADADGPAPGSSIDRQVDFWTKAAAHYAPSVEVLTFAPYCPLQHAYDRRDQTQEGKYLERLEGWYASGAVAGFKLYPPMGYFPTGNRGRPDRDYVGQEGVRGGIVKAWRAGGAAADTLGNALEDALDAFYAVCKTRDVPVIAHAGPSNMPAEAFLDRPNPVHWTPVARSGVRLMLGHFAFRADLFVAEMSKPIPKTVWAITSAAPLIKAHRNVWIDISYVNEVLGDDGPSRRLADDFYAELLRYCADVGSPSGGCDPDFDQIVYGSDWIMLHREADHRRYLQIARDHMTKAPWPPDAFEKIASKNADRFLARTT